MWSTACRAPSWHDTARAAFSCFLAEQAWAPMEEAVPPRRTLKRSVREASKALGCIAVPLLGLFVLAAIPCCGHTLFPQPKSSRVHEDMRALQAAVQEYVRRTGGPPDGLSALVDAGDLESMPLDPWNNPYQFSVHSKEWGELSTLGQDGEPGGEGDDADVVNRFQLAGPPP